MANECELDDEVPIILPDHIELTEKVQKDINEISTYYVQEIFQFIIDNEDDSLKEAKNIFETATYEKFIEQIISDLVQKYDTDLVYAVTNSMYAWFNEDKKDE